MKKSVSLFLTTLIALFVAVLCGLTACADDSAITNYGVVTDTPYGLSVSVVGGSVIRLPSCDKIIKVNGDTTEDNYSLKEGDLICLTFDSDTYGTYDVIPADYVTSPTSIVCYAEGLSIEYDSINKNNYSIIVPAEKTGSVTAGITLTVTVDGAAFTAEVTAVADGKVTLYMSTDDAKTFLKEYNNLTIG